MVLGALFETFVFVTLCYARSYNVFPQYFPFNDSVFFPKLLEAQDIWNSLF